MITTARPRRAVLDGLSAFSRVRIALDPTVTRRAPPPVPAPGSSLADAIRSWRTAMGWSRRELARRLPAGESTIAAWEQGQTEPGRRRLAALIRLGFVPPARQAPKVMGAAA